MSVAAMAPQDRPDSAAMSEDSDAVYGTPAQSPLQTPGLHTPRENQPFLAPAGHTTALETQPSMSFMGATPTATPRDSYGPRAALADPTPNASNAALATEKPVGAAGSARRTLWKRPLFWIIAAAAAVVVVLAIVLPVVLVNKSKNDSNSAGGSSSGSSSSGGSSSDHGSSTSGGNGSEIATANGKVLYNNPFGGIWVNDTKDPFNANAYPNSWTPPLNTSWTWGKERVYGVNLGGWFVLEPYITPALFQKYPEAVDEWTLSQAIANDTSSGGLQAVLENHYDTFITEADFIQIVGAGLNWVRIPIPYWAIETWDGEPFLERVSWKYILRAFDWARKYGLRIYLDLHTVPGSQNGYNHSGKLGQINFMKGVMGLANAQRTLSYIRIITEFISQKEYKDVIPLFGIVNEVFVNQVGQDTITSFYVEAMNMIRGNITGYGAGNGPFITIHDGFLGTNAWKNWMNGTDRLVLDMHPYFAFDGQPNTDPIAAPEKGLLVASGASGGVWPQQACSAWRDNFNVSQADFGVTIAGEFSNAINDCGLYINGVSNGPSYSGDCTPFIEWENWDQTTKDGFHEFMLATMDAIDNWYFWTWKIGNSSAGTVQAPLWSYQLGLENGWMPTDPRAAVGKCASLIEGASTTILQTYTYQASQTGNPTPSPIPASLTQSYPWPPTTLSGVDAAAFAFEPTYTPTGTVSTLPMPSVTKGVSEGSGWANAQDQQGAFTAVAGCSYPNAWDSNGVVAPTAACTGSAAAQRRWMPAPTAK